MLVLRVHPLRALTVGATFELAVYVGEEARLVDGDLLAGLAGELEGIIEGQLGCMCKAIPVNPQGLATKSALSGTPV